MSVAALITWIITALGGAYMLRLWLARGGVRQQRTGESRFPAAVIFGHFLLAAAGLVIWVVYLLADGDALAWVAFAVLVPVALLGFAMLARWLSGRRARVGAAAAGGGTAEPAEQAFPVAVVVAHGLLAVVTVVLVLLAAAGAGGS